MEKVGKGTSEVENTLLELLRVKEENRSRLDRMLDNQFWVQLGLYLIIGLEILQLWRTL